MPGVREAQGRPPTASGGAKGNCCSLVKYEEVDREKQPEDDRGGEEGHPCFRVSPESQGYLILLFVVQLFSVSIRLSDERVHQHQEGHVE